MKVAMTFRSQIFTHVLMFEGDLQGSLILSSGQEPAIEGDALEFTCDVTSSSLPAAYRPTIYYSWQIRGDWQPEITPSGPLLNHDEDIIPGYVVKNNGRTLVISSANLYDQYIRCRGREDGGRDVYCFHSVEIGRENYKHLILILNQIIHSLTFKSEQIPLYSIWENLSSSMTLHSRLHFLTLSNMNIPFFPTTQLFENCNILFTLGSL